MRLTWTARPLSVALLLLTAACGTTVPMTAQSSTGTDGLGQPFAAPITSPAPQALAPSSSGRLPAGGNDVSGQPTTGPGGSGARGAIEPGAGGRPARVTTPLKIGIIYLTDGGAAQSLGLNQGVSDFTPEQVARGLVKGFNAQGGLFGRRLEAFYAGWSTSSNDYSTDAAAICAKFATDTPVPVVIDLGVGNLGGLPDCLAKHGIVHLSTGFETDLQGLKALPLHINTAFLSVERTYLNTIDRLSSVGYLTRASKLGVVREDCPEDVRAYQNVLLPRIQRQLGQTPLLVTTRCSNGLSGASVAGADISNAVLRFRGSGVDRVMIVSHFESIALVLFSNAAESQGYRPGYALSSYASAAGIAASLQDGQRPGLHGGGWRPGLDTSTSSFGSASERRCLAVFSASGSRATLPNDKGAVGVSCAPLLVLERLLQVKDGAFSRETMLGAMARFGSGIQLPTLLTGVARLSPDRRDMPSAGQAFGWVTSCSCLRYAGPVAAID
jgi:hypothetical protein